MGSCVLAVLQGGRLTVSVLHYPLLLRWADWYRGAHPSKYLPQYQQKQHGANLHGRSAGPGTRQPDRVLTCNIAGKIAGTGVLDRFDDRLSG